MHRYSLKTKKFALVVCNQYCARSRLTRKLTTQNHHTLNTEYTMEEYQKGILSDVAHTSTFATIFLNNSYINNGDEAADKTLKKLIGEFPQWIQEFNIALEPHIASGFNKSGIIGVISISADLVKRILPSLPVALWPQYRELKGAESYSIFPKTGGEIFLHLKSDQRDPCFMFMRKFVKHLKQIKVGGESIFVKSEEINGFVHQFNTKTGLERDLTSFEDGTKNPKTLEAKVAATIVPDYSGSFVITQRWVHDLDLWEALPVEDQEKVFGRTKKESDKLPGKPPSSHVSLTDLGKKKGEILRHSMPYGDSTEHGLFFLGYSAEIKRFDEMLENMIKASSMNPHLDMMKYIKCVSGQYFYAPSVSDLKSIAQ